MRIAILADHPPFTGIGNYSFKLLEHLRALTADEVDLFYFAWSNRDWKPEEGSNRVVIATKHLPFRSVSFYRAQIRSPIPIDYDVYHATHPLLGNIAPLPTKSVMTVADLLPMLMPKNYPIIYSLQFRLQVRSVSRMRRVIAISENTRLDMERLLGIPRTRVETIPFGVDEDFAPGPSTRDELGLRQDAKVLLHVGSEEDRKNIPFLLEVFSRVRERLGDVKLVRVGLPRPSTRRLLKSLSLDHHVIYTGRTSKEELRAYYRSSDLLLFPSAYEGFGFPPLEAMACGCPVVSSDRASLPEIVGEGGIRLPLRVEAWAEALVSVLSNDKKRSELIQAGLRQSKNFRWRDIAARTHEIYREMV